LDNGKNLKYEEGTVITGISPATTYYVAEEYH